MINQADQMRGNLIIDRVVSFILSSLIVALPFLALLLMKYPPRTPWSPLGSSSLLIAADEVIE